MLIGGPGGVTISELPPAGPLTGAEKIPMDQLPPGSPAGTTPVTVESPLSVLIQTFGITGATGPVGPAAYLDADQGEEGPLSPGPTGAQGPTGATGPQGPATYMSGDQGEDPDWAFGPQGVRGFTGFGAQGPATFLEADVGEEGPLSPGPVGPQGITGAQGPVGPAVAFIDTNDGADFSDGQTVHYFDPSGWIGPTQINVADNIEALHINVVPGFTSGTYFGFDSAGSNKGAIGMGPILGGDVTTADIALYATSGRILLSANGTSRVVIGEHTGIPVLQLAQGGGAGAGVMLLGSNAGQGPNWLIGEQYNVNGSLEITPSTAAGGSTFTTPLAYFSTGTALTLNPLVGNLGIVENMKDGSGSFNCRGTAATQTTPLTWQQGVQAEWILYQSAGSNDTSFWLNTSQGNVLNIRAGGGILIPAPTVNSNALVAYGANSGTQTVANFSSADSTNQIYIQYDYNGTGYIGSSGAAAHALGFKTGNTLYGSVQVDGSWRFGNAASSGNTAGPGTGGGFGGAIQLYNGFLSSDGAGMYVGGNSYYDGTNYRYQTASTGTLYVQNNDSSIGHQWYGAPAGGAGAIMSLTEYMRLQVGGGLILYTPASGVALVVNGVAGSFTQQLFAPTTNNVYLGFFNGTTGELQRLYTDNNKNLFISNDAGSTQTISCYHDNSIAIIGGKGIVSGLSGVLDITSQSSGGTQTVYLRGPHTSGWPGVTFHDTAAGPNDYDIGIGAGDASNRLNFYNRTAGSVAGSWNAASRFLVGGTSESPTGTTHRVAITAVGVGTEYGVVINMSSGVTVNSTHYMTFGSAGTQAGSITAGAAAASVLYSTGSDYRLKTDVQPLVGGLDAVMKMQPRSFTWIKDQVKDTGFIAHELQAIVPAAVHGEKDGMCEDGVTPDYQGVDATKLVVLLVAAIQEQQATISALKTGVVRR